MESSSSRRGAKSHPEKPRIRDWSTKVEPISFAGASRRSRSTSGPLDTWTLHKFGTQMCRPIFGRRFGALPYLLRKPTPEASRVQFGSSKTIAVYHPPDKSSKWKQYTEGSPTATTSFITT